MKAKFRIENPDDVEATITITMKIGEWKEIKDQLARQHPSWKLASAITQTIRSAEKVFCSGEQETV